jgi:hypothetical protein
VRAERQQRRDERVVAAEDREPGRRIGQQRDRVGVDAADGVLDTDHPGQRRQPAEGVDRQVLPGAVGDVVHDDRHRAGRRQRREVRHHTRLAGADERRHQAEGDRRLRQRPHGRQRVGADQQP